MPESLHNKRVLALDLAGMVAGATYRGELEERLKAVIGEIEASEGQIILLIDELHTLVVGLSGRGPNPSYLRTHPATRERVARLHALKTRRRPRLPELRNFRGWATEPPAPRHRSWGTWS